MLGTIGWISIKYGAYTTVPWALIVQLSLILYVKTHKLLYQDILILRPAECQR
jgi:hypothetical protein